MKKLIIATSILFAFSATFAQEGKPSKKIPMSSKAPTSVSANEAKPNMKPNVKPNVKPVGKTSTKPTPVVSKVSPVKGAKPVGPSSNRAAASSKGNTVRPEKATGKGDKGSTVNTRAAAGTRPSNNEKATGKGDKGSSVNTRAAAGTRPSNNEKATGKGDKGSSVNTRAAAGTIPSNNEKATGKGDKGSSVNTRAAAGTKPSNNEKATGKGDKGSTVNTRTEKVSDSKVKDLEPVMSSEVKYSKPDSDFCKGWKEGYIKAYAKATGEKISSADVPNCVSQGDCEGYKCGYAAGVKNAERRIK
jgi:hypothetical protein